ncbi:MAG: tetratricopeptide repeat protein [Ferruginibacter sp.]
MSPIQLLFSLFFFAGLTVSAQTLEQGNKFLYYERFKSAKSVFVDLLKKEPNNEQAIYGYALSCILPDEHSPKDLEDAKTFLQTKLRENAGNALITVAIAHVELLQGQISDARAHFEMAINAGGAKSIAVLNAVGFANSNPDTKNGDAQYAIDKLTAARQLKKFNDPSVLVNLGDAYRKIGDGGKAVVAYRDALSIDPSYARAYFRIGKLYQTQGRGQQDLIMENYNKTIEVDKQFAPVYAALFNYYYDIDINKAAEYFDVWTGFTDQDSKFCYYKASFKLVQGFFQDAIAKADECLRESEGNFYPGIPGLKAVAFSRLRDSLNAVRFYSDYFKLQNPEKLTAGDYLDYGRNLIRLNPEDSSAIVYFNQALAMDFARVKDSMFRSAKEMVARKKYKTAADLYATVGRNRKTPEKSDWINAGNMYFYANQYQASADCFKGLIDQNPEEITYYESITRAYKKIDSTGSQGLIVPYYIKYIELAEKEIDLEKIKDKLVGAYSFMMEYAYFVAKDQKQALMYVDKAIARDPSNKALISNRDIILKTKPR